MNIGHNSQMASIDALPASMQEIADVLGLGIVFALVEHFPGAELRIPHKLKDDHKLMVLGRSNAKALCRYCPNDTIHVPLALDRKRLKRQVDALSARGLTRWQVARELGITQRHVRRLANTATADDAQFNLFQDLDD